MPQGWQQLRVSTDKAAHSFSPCQEEVTFVVVVQMYPHKILSTYTIAG